MPKFLQWPYRRGPAQSNSRIPIAARASVPLNPRGPATGFFTPPLYRNRAQPGNVSPKIDAPLAAMHGALVKGVHFE